jgi:hypothetical protein
MTAYITNSSTFRVALRYAVTSVKDKGEMVIEFAV